MTSFNKKELINKDILKIPDFYPPEGLFVIVYRIDDIEPNICAYMGVDSNTDKDVWVFPDDYTDTEQLISHWQYLPKDLYGRNLKAKKIEHSEYDWDDYEIIPYLERDDGRHFCKKGHNICFSKFSHGIHLFFQNENSGEIEEVDFCPICGISRMNITQTKAAIEEDCS